MKLETTRREQRVRMERKAVLTVGFAALGLFMGGYFLAHFKNSVLKIATVGFYAAAALVAVYFMWAFLRGMIWKTEKSLFLRAVQNYDPEGKAKLSVPKCSPIKNS